MESFRTVFRLVVMLVALVLGYKGWQLYGPPTDRLKAIAGRALEIAAAALGEEGQSAGGSPSLSADPQVAAPVAFAAPLPVITNPVVAAQSLVPIEPGAAEGDPAGVTPPALLAAPASPPALSEPPADPIQPSSHIEPSPEDDMAPLYTRLEQLGVHQRELAEWGNSGQLYRFGCQASVGDSPDFSRHFESFAAEPRAAVEEVVAKVEAWRAAQRGERQVGVAVQ